VGRLLDELAPLADSLDPRSDDACLLRLARRDYEKAIRVPTELRVEMARAAAEANPIWIQAKAPSSFALFLGPLAARYHLVTHRSWQRRRRLYVFGAFYDMPTS
jgi:carboxypeptidase Taq